MVGPLPTRAALETVSSTESCLQNKSTSSLGSVFISSPPGTVIAMATETADCFQLSKSSNSDTNQSYQRSYSFIPISMLFFLSLASFHLISHLVLPVPSISGQTLIDAYISTVDAAPPRLTVIATRYQLS